MAVGRFAPSPSGPLHLGNLRTALLAWLFARSAGSRFVLRIEDLDPASSRPEHVEGQIDDLAHLGLDWDDLVVQSTRFERHLAVLDELERLGRLYRCYCSRRDVAAALQAAHGDDPAASYPGTCRHLTTEDRSRLEGEGRPWSLRLAADGEVVAFDDRVHGRVERPAPDVVVRRNDGRPAYNLAVVVDDHDEGVEEVVRGDDLLPSTPAQVLVARWLGWDEPAYAHVPLVLGPDGERLAKRHGDVTFGDWIGAGRSSAELRAVLARSVGLPDAAVARDEPEALVVAFDPTTIPRAPWTVPAALLGR